MNKKILGVIIVAILIVMLVILTGCANEKKIQNNSSIETETKKVQTAEETINNFFEYMKNQEFTSAIDLINIDEFNNITKNNFSKEELEEFLNNFYNNFSDVYSYSIGEITKIENAEEFQRITETNNMTDDEFKENFGNNLVYCVDLEKNGDLQTDIYILTNDYKLVCTATFISYSSSNNRIYEQASSNASETDKMTVKEKLNLAMQGVSTDFIVSGGGSNFSDFCTKEIINEYLTEGSAVESLSWENEKGTGIILYKGEKYKFTLTVQGKSNVTVTIE